MVENKVETRGRNTIVYYTKADGTSVCGCYDAKVLFNRFITQFGDGSICYRESQNTDDIVVYRDYEDESFTCKVFKNYEDAIIDFKDGILDDYNEGYLTLSRLEIARLKVLGFRFKEDFVGGMD